MISNRLTASVCGALALILATSLGAQAHHSFAGQFNPNGSMEIVGELIEIRWINPHAQMTVRTIENGQTVDWELETAGASQMVRSGVERDFLEIGDRVRVAGWPPVTDRREMHATNMLTPDGQELILFRGATPQFADRGTGSYDYARQREGDGSRPELGLFRVWSFTGLSTFLVPEDVNANFDLETYPMTAAARSSVASYDRVRDNPTLNCTPKGLPMIMENPYPFEFTDNGNTIVIRIEEYDLERTIHMDQDSTPAGTANTNLGYSVGEWDQDTLVVTTTNVSWPWFDQMGIPQSSEAVLVERFTPRPDGSRMDYTVTTTDAVNFTDPVTLNRYWLDLGETIVPYQCEEDA